MSYYNITVTKYNQIEIIQVHTSLIEQRIKLLQAEGYNYSVSNLITNNL